MKTCTLCNETKALELFAIDRRNKNGRGSHCKACKVTMSWVGDLRRIYAITVEEYEALLAAQGGVCYICQRPPAGRRLAVDHDHKSGLLRGLLCSVGQRSCNYGLLAHRDKDPAMFQRAADYLLHPPAVAVLGERRVPVQPKRRKSRRRIVPFTPSQSDLG